MNDHQYMYFYIDGSNSNMLNSLTVNTDKTNFNLPGLVNKYIDFDFEFKIGDESLRCYIQFVTKYLYLSDTGYIVLCSDYNSDNNLYPNFNETYGLVVFRENADYYNVDWINNASVNGGTEEDYNKIIPSLRFNQKEDGTYNVILGDWRVMFNSNFPN